ncbi:hypothetical protein ACFQL7_00325 [Halocatena marina]|uniref:Type II secretion system protein GspF domain-containing protein n=1 Tax=Halocatena marina TaxID=2934937 RepID=A0ABD5YLE4_9EURY
MTSNPGPLDRGLYALFSRHAESTRHDQDRRYFRGTAFKMDFDFYLARIYGLSWGVFVLTVIVSATVVGTVPATGIPRSVLTSFEAWSLSRVYVALASGTLLGLIGKRLVLLGGRGYLKWIRTVRRENIEQTLPGAVRYLRTLAAGSDDQRTLLRKVAEQETYGETAVGFRRALNHAALTGNLDSGLRRVARDTPSEDLLAPFLLKFGEHAAREVMHSPVTYGWNHECSRTDKHVHDSDRATSSSSSQRCSSSCWSFQRFSLSFSRLWPCCHPVFLKRYPRPWDPFPSDQC